jgi:hypothetical protein
MGAQVTGSFVSSVREDDANASFTWNPVSLHDVANPCFDTDPGVITAAVYEGGEFSCLTRQAPTPRAGSAPGRQQCRWMRPGPHRRSLALTPMRVDTL